MTEHYATFLLSLIVFLPAVGALGLFLVPRGRTGLMKWCTLVVTIVTLGLSLVAACPHNFKLDDGSLQTSFSHSWIKALDINYAMGLDGISLPLVVLTTALTVLAMGASWGINKNVRAYCILFLFLETGTLGVFVSADLFLFYVFWEVMLLPMYFLIGVWGGPQRMYAALKFFLFTLFGGALMLIAILLLYFASDLRGLDSTQLARAGFDETSIDSIRDSKIVEHTFNIQALQQLGQHTDQFSEPLLWGATNGWWIFVLLFIGFLIKVPGVPFHTWLPDAHVQAPTPISMLLAGVLLKLGGYGIIRVCYPVCPEAAYDLAPVVCAIGIISMVYGAFAAMAAKDFKRLVAYSSVSHMGYVVLGLGAWSMSLDPQVATAQLWQTSWSMGVSGAMFQMIGHGISSAGMFFMVGVLYDRVHHRDLDQFGGVMEKMPLYGGLAVGIFFAGLGLPGLCGFVGEVMVTLSVWNYSKALAVIAAAVVLLTAGYILWTIQRVYLGGEYKGPNAEGFSRISVRELLIGTPLLAFAILFGVYPDAVLNYTTPSVNKMVDDLSAWGDRNPKPVEVEPEPETAELAKPTGGERQAGG